MKQIVQISSSLILMAMGLVICLAVASFFLIQYRGGWGYVGAYVFIFNLPFVTTWVLKREHAYTKQRLTEGLACLAILGIGHVWVMVAKVSDVFLAMWMAMTMVGIFRLKWSTENKTKGLLK